MEALARKQALRLAGSTAVRLDAASCDSSLKKVTPFLKKVRERLGEETRTQLVTEVCVCSRASTHTSKPRQDPISLTHNTSFSHPLRRSASICQSTWRRSRRGIAEAKLKAADMRAALELCCTRVQASSSPAEQQQQQQQRARALTPSSTHHLSLLLLCVRARTHRYHAQPLRVVRCRSPAPAHEERNTTTAAAAKAGYAREQASSSQQQQQPPPHPCSAAAAAAPQTHKQQRSSNTPPHSPPFPSPPLLHRYHQPSPSRERF